MFDELEVLEIDLQILSADVRDAQFASGHAAEFVARVDDGVVVAVVQETDFTPSAVGEEFEAEVSSHLGHAEVEVHAGKGDVAVAFNRERTVFLPVDDFQCGSHSDVVASDTDGKQGELGDVRGQFEGVVVGR